MDSTEFNRQAWNAIASSSKRWFVPASSDEIAAARNGQPAIKVTAIKNIPPDWLDHLPGKRILCLAAGGGHQGPLLAAAGAVVTVVDFSEEQLAIDQSVAEREGLSLKTIRCDMRRLGEIGDFDFVINPCSLNFCPEVLPVWQEAYRVLVPGGTLIAGFVNPVNYLFAAEPLMRGKFIVANRLPHIEGDVLLESEITPGIPPTPVEYGHTLTDLIGGQTSAGFKICDFFEDRWGGNDPLSNKTAVFIATRAKKPQPDSGTTQS